MKIRDYDKQIDLLRLEALERRCEVGSEDSASFIADTLGDPICRVRNSPVYKVLVAELNDELVGVIQGTIKDVTLYPCQASAGYILGLRVSPMHRRKGVGLSLVKKMEEWLTDSHVSFAYMATDKENEASVKLFTDKLQYVKFRTPSILVNPVSHHLVHISPSAKFVKLKADHAERLYRKFVSSTDFFSHDIDRILQNRLSLGTWIAYLQEGSKCSFDFKSCFPNSWAMLSVWNTGGIFKLKVTKPSLACLMYARSSSFMDRFFPFFKLPFVPDIFKPFGFYFMYGLYRQGPMSGSLMHSLCQLVHNMATECADCQVTVTEVANTDTLKLHIPHSKLLSCPEDLWCIKALRSEVNRTLSDLTRTPHPGSLFIDPREIAKERRSLMSAGCRLPCRRVGKNRPRMKKYCVGFVPNKS